MKKGFYIALGQYKSVMWTLRHHSIAVVDNGIFGGKYTIENDDYYFNLSQNLEEAKQKAAEFIGCDVNDVIVDNSAHQNSRGEKRQFPYDGTFHFGKYVGFSPTYVMKEDSSYLEWYILNGHTNSVRDRALLADAEIAFGKTRQEIEDENEKINIAERERKEANAVQVNAQNAKAIEILSAMYSTPFVDSAIETLKDDFLYNQRGRFVDIIIDMLAKFEPLTSGGKPRRKNSKAFNEAVNKFKTLLLTKI